MKVRKLKLFLQMQLLLLLSQVGVIAPASSSISTRPRPRNACNRNIRNSIGFPRCLLFWSEMSTKIRTQNVPETKSNGSSRFCLRFEHICNGGGTILKYFRQAQPAAIVTVTFYLLAPTAVRLTDVTGKTTTTFVHSIWNCVRNTCDRVVQWAKRNTVLNQEGVLHERTQFLAFIIVSREIIIGILQDAGTEKDRVKAIQEGKIVKVATEAIGIRMFRPRPMFALGAYARALQLCTTMQYSFSPSIGVSAVINYGALNIMRVKWVAYFVVGWATTPHLWKLFGACSPIALPPTLTTTREQLENKELSDNSNDDDDHPAQDNN